MVLFLHLPLKSYGFVSSYKSYAVPVSSLNVIFRTFTGIVNRFLCASLVLAVISGIKVLFFVQWTYFVPDHIHSRNTLFGPLLLE